MNVSMAERVVYEGRDLEAMAFARNYHQWILEAFAPYLGARLVEVGAGTGSFSEMLARLPVESLSLVEPSETMYRRLLASASRMKTRARVTTYNAVFASVAERVRAEQRPDSVIYVNVLEHIDDDFAELRTAHRTLAGGGRIFIFVPALRWLYSPFDRRIGHRRRYTRARLRSVVERAGFRVLKAIYFDAAGIIPWWVKYRLLRSEKMEPRAVRLYDEYVVPTLRRIETRFPPFAGKNVLLIGER